MNKEKQQEFMKYLDEQCDKLTQEEKALKLDQRKDEANHVKIQFNIYQIFQTIFRVTAGKSTEDQIESDFLAQMERIPESWKKALESANKHQDQERIYIETLKFQTRDQIRETFVGMVNGE